MLDIKTLQQFLDRVEEVNTVKQKAYDGKDFEQRGELLSSLSNLLYDFADIECDVADEEVELDHRKSNHYALIRKDNKTNIDTEKKVEQHFQKDILALKLKKNIVKKIAKKINSFEAVQKHLDRFHFRDYDGIKRMT